MGYSFKDFTKDLGKAGKWTGKNVVKPAIGTIGKAGQELGKTFTGFRDIAQRQASNLTNLTSPSNIMLYLGVGVVAIVMLPRILDSKGVERIVERVPVKG